MVQPAMFEGAIFENLRKFINIIDELRDVGLNKIISLPRIAVLGTQSAGKSSLLENIVGIDFLPRGEGVVTRRPLELRMEHKSEAECPKPYAIFEEIKGQQFTDFGIVKQKIIELTDKVAGSNKNIVDDPIVLKVFSSTCPDLTIIDLPGITKNPIGDQPSNIEEITTNLCEKYCCDPMTIILCVSPANQDLSTSDSLKFARLWDKDGVRTIGVITKIDLMDSGTDARKILLGNEINLKLGFVGVKNRSQKDINDKIGVLKGLESERDFFTRHHVYASLPQDILGTDSLTVKLTQELFHHIRRSLPEIIRDIEKRIREYEERLQFLGTAIPKSTQGKVQLLWEMVNKFTIAFKDSIRGKYIPKKKNETPTSHSAEIMKRMNNIFDIACKKSPNFSLKYSDRDINNVLEAYEGEYFPGFPSIDAFLALLIPMIEELEVPAYSLIQDIYLELEKITVELVNEIFERFPNFISFITDQASVVLISARDKTQQIITDIVQAEKNYIYTTDETYTKNRANYLTEMKKGEDPAKFNPQKLFIEELRKRLDGYFAIILRNLKDSVPRIVGQFLVRKAETKMQFDLIEAINKNVEILSLMDEPESIALERDMTSKSLDILRKSVKVIKKDPDLAIHLLKKKQEEEEELLSKATVTPTVNANAEKEEAKKNEAAKSSTNQKVISANESKPSNLTPNQNQSTIKSSSAQSENFINPVAADNLNKDTKQKEASQPQQSTLSNQGIKPSNSPIGSTTQDFKQADTGYPQQQSSAMNQGSKTTQNPQNTNTIPPKTTNTSNQQPTDPKPGEKRNSTVNSLFGSKPVAFTSSNNTKSPL